MRRPLAEIAKLGLADRVTIRPIYTQEQGAELYRSHDILLHPKYLDPCPTVVIESLASGLPVVGRLRAGFPKWCRRHAVFWYPLRWFGTG